MPDEAAVRARLLENPDETWTVEQRLAYVFDAKPLFEAGKGWSYADTNYIVLGAIVEKATQRSSRQTKVPGISPSMIRVKIVAMDRTLGERRDAAALVRSAP